MKLLEEYVNAFVLGILFAKKYVANRREICCKSERNQEEIRQILRGGRKVLVAI